MSTQTKNQAVTSTPQIMQEKNTENKLESLSFCDNSSSAERKSLEVVKPVKRIPLPEMLAKKYAVNELVAKGISELQNYINRLVSQVDFFKAPQQKILVPARPDAGVLIEDFFTLPLARYDTHDTYYTNNRTPDYIKYCREEKWCVMSRAKICELMKANSQWDTETDAQLKAALLPSCENGLTWRFIDANQVQKNSNILKKNFLKWFSQSGIEGITCSSDLYFYFPTNESRHYDYRNHDRVVDIYAHTLNREEAPITYAFKNDFLLQIDTDCLQDHLDEDENVLCQQANQILKTMQPLNAEGLDLDTNGKNYFFTHTEAFEQYIQDKIHSGETVQIGTTVISEESVQKQLQQLSLRGDEQAAMLESLRKRDFYRANITEYDEKMYSDPGRGCWELFGTPQDGTLLADCKHTVYARDPRADIQQGGVIGIDFGTKSTVVVKLTQDNRILPLRIGSGRFEKAPTAQDYENPTVMHFENIQKFMEQYRKKGGRPFTAWEDLTVSHTAYESWNNNEDTSKYSSFFGELKQWAGTPGKRVRIRDGNDYEVELPTYLELSENEIDPIELYAYYIGLYINNQNTGNIYLEYLLSFPVTYEVSVREHILESFRHGLKRSLPNAILNDPQCMESFTVSEGAGEPAAYAVCALQEFGFRPEGEEKIVYGIFDFGGGTTDFDFGVWRSACGAKERRYRYVIQHFGDGGDRYLGGENLLADMAYRVFKNNQDQLRNAHITFSRPIDPFCKEFPGCEYLLAESQEANSNMKQLCERLRPLWEGDSEAEENLENGVIKIRLFDRNGNKLENFELTVDIQELYDLLQERIEQGVSEFFSALKKVCRKENLHKEISNAQVIHIFLAGNSSKSEIVKDIFQKQIESETQAFQEEIACAQDCDAENLMHLMDESENQALQIFKLHNPLGTTEANEEIQRTAELEIERPTGKTGVAIGLVQCRRGGKIKVINEVSAGEEIKFKFSIGDEDVNGYFMSILTRETAYNQWIEYLDAGESFFEFYYTTLPSAELESTLPANQTRLQRLSIPQKAVNEDWVICLRCVSPDEIEYVVAENIEKAAANEYKCEVRRVKLTEGE